MSFLFRKPGKSESHRDIRVIRFTQPSNYSNNGQRLQFFWPITLTPKTAVPAA